MSLLFIIPPMRNPWNLVSAFALIYGGVGRLTHLPQSDSIGIIGIAIGLIMVCHYFFFKTKKEFSTLQQFKVCLENDAKILLNFKLEDYGYWLWDTLDIWQGQVVKNFDKAYPGTSDADDLKKEFERNWELAKRRFRDPPDQLKEVIKKNINTIKTKLQRDKPISPTVDPKDFQTFVEYQKELIERQKNLGT